MATYLDGLITARALTQSGGLSALDELIAQLKTQEIETMAVVYDTETR